MTSKDRLFEYIKYKGLPISKFERLSGVSNGYLKSSRGGFGADKLDIILKNNPDLNPEWLLTGEGNMLKSSSSSSGDIVITNTNGNGNAVGGSSVSTSSEELAVLRAETKMQKEQIERLYKQIEKLEAQNEKLLNAITK